MRSLQWTEGSPVASVRRDVKDGEQAVVRWLLDSDPSIRWQVMRDLTDESDAAVAAERARVAAEGWGARLLSLQEPDGNWGGGAWVTGAGPPRWRP